MVVPDGLGYRIIRSRREEPIIAVSITHIVGYSDWSLLVTLFIDEFGVEFVKKALALTPRAKHVKLVTRKEHQQISLVEELKNEAEKLGYELEVEVSKRLHVKIYASDHRLLITSANLLESSLLKNVEVCVYVEEVVREIENILEFNSGSSGSGLL